MATVGDDCYFFCTSTCAKGAACPFRHVESAKTNKIVCQHWQTTGCFRPMCKFRHSDFHIQVNYGEIPCYWESQPVGCSKPNCVYKHTKPRSDTSKTAILQPQASMPEQKDGSDKNNGETTAEAVDTFVMPTVKPVIIDPESEASNSSPVKKPPPKEEVQEKEKETAKETKALDNDTDKKGEAKKVVKKTIGKKKKAAGVLTQKNGKSGMVKKVMKKKAKNNSADPASKVPLKKKKAVSVKSGEKSAVPLKKKVQDRLGTKPVADVAPQKKKMEESSSSSDSDDSIENVKVLSMEEIFRQKALESMMKKRAAEGKPMLPEYNSPKKKSEPPRSQQSNMGIQSKKKPAPIEFRRQKPPIVDSRPKKINVDNSRVQNRIGVKRKAPVPPSPLESEEEEEEDDEVEEDVTETEEEQNEIRTVKKNNEDKTSSSESESSGSDSTESEDDEVRRVVINLDAEKAAREKAKASLARRGLTDFGPRSALAKKRKVIREEKMPSLSFSRHVQQQRVSVKERLGKSSTSVVGLPGAQRDVKKVSSSASSAEEDIGNDKVESDENDDERFSGLAVKSLEEIRAEKLKRIGNSPIQERLSPEKIDQVEDEQDSKSAREILISDDPTISKKSRKRPWSSKGRDKKTKVVVKEMSVEEDQRTVSATSPVDTDPVVVSQNDEPESPFESLRRRALLKKTQQLQEKESSEARDGVSEELDEADEESSGKRKKHKHKHKHKKHKKSKSERQIYVPPAKKSVITEVLEQVKKVQQSLQSGRDEILEYEEQGVGEDSITTNSAMATQQRARPRAAAMWSAGLSVSSKGMGARPHLKAGLGADKREIDEMSMPSQRLSLTTSKMSTSALSTSIKDSTGGSSVPVVKTFSQIMAEKRQKRMQQAQASGARMDMSSNKGSPSKLSLSSSPSRLEDARPRAPITPIRFDIDDDDQLSRVKQTSTATIFDHKTSSKSGPSFSSSASAISAQSHVSPMKRNKHIDPSSSSSTFGASKLSSSTSSILSSAVSLSDVRPTYKTARAKKLFGKKASAASTPSESSDMSSSHIPSLSSSSSHLFGSGRISPEVNNPGIVASSGDAAIALKSPTIEQPTQRRVSNASDSHSKPFTPLEDEFSFFEGADDVEDISDIVGKDVEPIDDLLQDIDDLLA